MSNDNYQGERFVPTVQRCGSILLKFNGKTLKMTAGAHRKLYRAYSGKKTKAGKFDYGSDRQRLEGRGPIPEGGYWIRPSELTTIAYSRSRNATAGWGNYRITIHPMPWTKTHGRGGFFIHGGKSPGSAGCIDLTHAMDFFVQDLKAFVGDNKTCHIRLTVEYERV